jgi:hypothetical protein
LPETIGLDHGVQRRRDCARDAATPLADQSLDCGVFSCLTGANWEDSREAHRALKPHAVLFVVEPLGMAGPHP